MGLRVGIDLGTTNSVVSHIKGGRPELVANTQGEYWTPSVVQLREDEILVGREAKDNMAFLPEDTIWSIKRFIGRSPGDPELEKARGLVPYIVEDPPPGKADLVVKLGGKTYTPVEISAMILKKLVDDTESALGQRPTDAVITVPAYFSERQMEATRRGGKLAGLNVRRVLDEPTAAALAYGLDLDPSAEKTLLVFDLGGGTFDVSILLLTGGQFTTLKITGDNFLGGDDFDNAILEHFLELIGKQYASDRSVRAHLKKHAEATKIALSQTNLHRVDTFIQADPAKPPIRLSTKLARADFEARTEKLVQRAIAQVELALKNAGMEPNDIQHVLMVGGSSRIPQVQAAVEKIFGAAKISKEMNPMLCVAQGAAILAETIGEGKDEGALVASCTAKPRGVELVNGNFDPIIPAETYYPMTEPIRQYYKTVGKNQRELRISVYEGEEKVAKRNEWQGEVVVDLADGIPEQTAVTVGLRLDNSGIVYVTVDVDGRPNAVKEARVDRTNRRVEPKADGGEAAGADTGMSAQLIMQIIGAYITDCSRMLRLFPASKKVLQTKLGDVSRALETKGEREATQIARTAFEEMGKEIDKEVDVYFFGNLVARGDRNPARAAQMKKCISDADAAVASDDLSALRTALIALNRFIGDVIEERKSEPGGDGGGIASFMGLAKA